MKNDNLFWLKHLSEKSNPKTKTFMDYEPGEVPASNTQSVSVETKPQTAPQQKKPVQSTTMPVKKQEIPAWISELPKKETPVQGSGYDPIKSSRERRERFGIGPLKPQTPQATKIPKMPAMIRKTSAIDPDREELTPEGEKAFLEGLASADGEKYDGHDLSVRTTNIEPIRQIDYSNAAILNDELADIEAAEKRDPNSAWYKRLVRAWESGDRKTYEQVEREMATRKERVKYILDSRNRTYEDDFIGQFGASYRDGSLGYEESVALENPTFDNMRYAEGLQAAREQFRRNNAETLAYDAENPLVSQIIPENLPRLIDRAGEGLEYFDASAVLDALDESARDMHYSRNRYNVDLPRTLEEARNSSDWEEKKLANCHQFTAPPGEENRNIKFVSLDGKREVIFNRDGQIVYAAEDQGSYNYADPDFWVQHGLLDVLPWILYGNTPYDTTTPQQRIGGLFDFG